MHHLCKPTNRSRTFRFAESDCARIALKVLHLYRAAWMTVQDLFGACLRPAEKCAANPSSLKCGMHSAEEEDARLLGIRHAVRKGETNRSSVWRNCNQRVTRHVNLATGELLHHVVNRVTNRVPYMRRVVIDKLHKRGRINVRLHGAERCPCWEHRADLF